MIASHLSHSNATCHIIHGDNRHALKTFENQVDLIITSPPYADARKGLYDSVHPDDYADWFCTFHEAFWQALKPKGSLVINIKDKIVKGVRHRYVWQTIERLAALGWYCIDDYIWAKKNAMPGYWPTRLRDGWEYCFHLAKCRRPFINQAAVRVPIKASTKDRMTRLNNNDLQRSSSATSSGFGRNVSYWKDKELVLPSNVLSVAVEGKNRKHPAAYPVELPSFFIKLLSPANGLVVDPFAGSGTTGVAALNLGRSSILIDNCYQYCLLAAERMSSADIISTNQQASS